MPNKSDNAYADYVIEMGKKLQLSSDELVGLRQGVIHVVQESRSRLIDQHTVNMITNTLCDALYGSQTFRDAVSYGIHKQKVPLDSIKYRNEYEINIQSPAEVEDIQSLTYSELHEYDVGEEPVFAHSYIANDDFDHPYVSFTVAPDIDSPELQSWQEGLIHEVIHHITGATDPVKNKLENLGPTEILARRVAHELGWIIPEFKGYSDPEREAHIRARNLNALRQAVARHEDHEQAFFERLDEISDQYEASDDFAEFSIVPKSRIESIKPHDFTGLNIDDNFTDSNNISLQHGAPHILIYGGDNQTNEETVLRTDGQKGITVAERPAGNIINKLHQENYITFDKVSLQKHLHAMLADKSPMQALKALTKITSIAVSAPEMAAMMVRPVNVSENHSSSFLATTVARGGMSLLAKAWISLLQLLYKQKCLSQKDIILALLPNRKQDKIKSLAHAIAGAAWHTEAATKMCALLSDAADNNERLRQDIIVRLSLLQSGYGFRQLKLEQTADFYNRAKHADKFNSNDDAKNYLKKANLIPKNRELYSMGSHSNKSDIIDVSNFEALLKNIKEEVIPQTLASHIRMAKEHADLERIKKDVYEKWHEKNALKEEQKQKNSEEMIASFIAHSQRQLLQNDLSKYKKNVDWEKAHIQKIARNSEKAPSWQGHSQKPLPYIHVAQKPLEKVNVERVIKDELIVRNSDEFSTGRVNALRVDRNKRIDHDIERRLEALRVDRNERIDHDIERRLEALRIDRNKRIDHDIERRLKALTKKDRGLENMSRILKEPE